MKVYTGTGDRGKTGLFSGERVWKAHERIEAYGVLDELNSLLGMLASVLQGSNPLLAAEVTNVQRDLFTIGAGLATTPGSSMADRLPMLSATRVAELEAEIDRMDAELPELSGFILPGGGRASSWAQVARAVCRRAERKVIRATAGSGSSEEAQRGHGRELAYLNRLSDYLFVLARYCNHLEGIPETPWNR